jgi:hypothetical protein
MHLYASERLAGIRLGLKQYNRLMRGAGREPCSERMFLHVEALADFSYFNRKREPDSLRRPARQFPPRGAAITLPLGSESKGSPTLSAGRHLNLFGEAE